METCLPPEFAAHVVLILLQLLCGKCLEQNWPPAWATKHACEATVPCWSLSPMWSDQLWPSVRNFHSISLVQLKSQRWALRPASQQFKIPTFCFHPEPIATTRFWIFLVLLTFSKYFHVCDHFLYLALISAKRRAALLFTTLPLKVRKPGSRG